MEFGHRFGPLAADVIAAKALHPEICGSVFALVHTWHGGVALVE